MCAEGISIFNWINKFICRIKKTVLLLYNMFIGYYFTVN